MFTSLFNVSDFVFLNGLLLSFDITLQGRKFGCNSPYTISYFVKVTYDTLYLDKFILAFLSLSIAAPQHSHSKILSDNDNLGLI